MGTRYKQYDVFKNSEFMGTMYAEDAMKLIGISRETLYQYTVNKKLYKGVWRIREHMTGPGSETGEKKRALEEWDDIRFRLNPRAKGWKEYDQQKKLENHRDSADALPGKEERV